MQYDIFYQCLTPKTGSNLVDFDLLTNGTPYLIDIHLKIGFLHDFELIPAPRKMQK